jgi:PKD repeat protein
MANAGPDQAVTVGTSFQLQGAVAFTGALPAISWKLYSGPGMVTFGDATLTNTTVNFSVPGIYTLELSAEDGVHAVAYDAVVITVTNGINVFIALDGTNVNISWTGGSPPYVVQWADELPAVSWNDIATTSAHSINVPFTNSTVFFRVIGQQE